MLLVETNIQEIMGVLSRLLGKDVVSVEPVEGGRNNQVYRLICGDSQRYFAKFYPDEGPNGRNRLDTEFTSLSFLRDNQIDCVPKPIAFDPDARCAVYEYIDGQSISSQNASAPDIDQVIDFVATLRKLSSGLSSGLNSIQGSGGFPAASEACFSVEDYLKSLETRWERLRSVEGKGSPYLELQSFLADDVAPFLTTMRARCESTFHKWDMPLSTQLDPKERTLSPSDIGFQNTIRRPNGQVVFIDLEYFGWDDPAKMISDFLLHPFTDLNDELKQRFWTGCLNIYAGHPGVAKRAALVYPLCGLKWCLLLLNEFMPESSRIRRFSQGPPADNSQLQLEQLSKARQLFHRVKHGNEPPF